MAPKRIWNDIRHSRANWISLSRIIASVAMLWCLLDGRGAIFDLYREGEQGPLMSFPVTLVHVAALLSLYAFISDFWDGWLARRRKEVTETGKLLDPLADKIFFFASLIGLWSRIAPDPARLAGAYTLAGLEVVLMFIGTMPLFVSAPTLPLGANKFGKLKFITEGIFLSALFSEKLGLAHISPLNILFPPVWLLWAAVVFAALSIAGHTLPLFLRTFFLPKK